MAHLAHWHLTIGTNGASIRRFYLEQFGDDFPIDEAFANCDRLYLHYVDTSSSLAKPGLYELISHLMNHGIRLGVCSSSSRRKIEYKLEKIGVLERFEEIVGGDEVEMGKPYPEPYLKLADKIGVPVEESLALEDSYNGIRSASSAGAGVVMIPDLLEPIAEIRGLCVDVVDSLHDVIRLF